MNKVVSLKLKKKTKSRYNLPKLNLDIDIYKLSILIIGLLSIALGCIAYKISNNDAYNTILSNVVKNFISNGYYNILKTLLKIELSIIIVTIFTSTNILGKYFLFLIPCIKTFLIGFISSYFYNEHSLNGALFCLVFIYPFFAISTTVLIYIINESYYFSDGLFSCVIQNKSTVSKINIRLYFTRILLCLTFLIALCTVNSYLIYILSNRIITIP